MYRIGPPASPPARDRAASDVIRMAPCRLLRGKVLWGLDGHGSKADAESAGGCPFFRVWWWSLRQQLRLFYRAEQKKLLKKSLPGVEEKSNPRREE